MHTGYKLLLAATIVSSSIGWSHQVSAQNDTYRIVSTSYQQPLTTIETYVGSKRVETVRYAIGSVDHLNDDLMYSAETNQVVDFKNSKRTVKSVVPAPMRIKKYKNAFYAMSISGFNQYSLTKYSLDFKKIGTTKRYTGFGKELIVTGGKLYVLADDMKGNDYAITLHTFDTTSFKSLHQKTFKHLLHADQICQDGSQLKIYGISAENDEKLTILSYDVKKQHVTKTMTTNQYVKGGVEKARTLSRETELIFNQDRIYEINHKTKQVRVLYDSKHDLVDYAYDAKTKTYHVLEEVTKTAEFRVKTLNRHFKPIAEYRLKKSDSVRPFRVL